VVVKAIVPQLKLQVALAKGFRVLQGGKDHVWKEGGGLSLAV
jgi:hypothetical protein